MVTKQNHQWMTTVFVEQPLASCGSPKYHTVKELTLFSRNSFKRWFFTSTKKLQCKRIGVCRIFVLSACFYGPWVFERLSIFNIPVKPCFPLKAFVVVRDNMCSTNRGNNTKSMGILTLGFQLFSKQPNIILLVMFSSCMPSIM